MIRLVLAAIFAVVTSAAAQAQDYAADGWISGFDWEGVYIGGGPTYLDGTYGLEAVAGGNVVMGDILFGLQASVAGYGGGAYTAATQARAGVIVDDNVMLYGLVGAGITDTSTEYLFAGGGMELGIAQNIALSGQVAATSPYGGQASVGLRWYLN